MPRARSDRQMTRIKGRLVLIGMLLVLLVVAAVAWLARRPIADAAIRRAIAARGIEADYTVKSIGLRWERIENVRIGNPKAPDLTAEWADIRVSAGFDGVRLRAVRAGGVRLRGRIIDRRLDLGDLDKLLRQGDRTAPVTLPDLDVDLIDARALLESEYGIFGARIDGKGNLADGFTGKIAVVGNTVQVGTCRADRATAFLDVSIADRRPTIKGPMRAAAIRCDGAAIANPAIRIAITLNETLDQWRGETNLSADRVSADRGSLGSLSGRASFVGNSKETRGDALMMAGTGLVGSSFFTGLRFEGTYSLGRKTEASGRLAVARVTPDVRLLNQLDTAALRASDTPVGPLLFQIARAARRAAAQTSFDAAGAFSEGALQISRLDMKSASGANLKAVGGRGVRIAGTEFQADTALTLSGGGFPTISSTLIRRTDGVTLGLARMAPFTSNGSRIALAQTRFAANRSGAMRVETIASIDGPVPGGRVQGLQFPFNATVSADGSVIVNNGCTAVRFRQVAVSGLALNPANLTLCPVDGRALLRFTNGRATGGAIVRKPGFFGEIGKTALALAAKEGRIIFGQNSFTLDGLKVKLGAADRLSTLEIGTLNGQFAGGNLQGQFAGAAGKIGAVPLLMTGAGGEWTLRSGALALRGRLTVSDEEVPGRFNPLISNDAVMRLVNNQIAATATLREPTSRTLVTSAVISHHLGLGTGSATLEVANLTFGKSFQPEQLTRLTLGVVANVTGAISGRGDIAWGPDGVTSTGRFATKAIDLAAAFGPVSGLKGEIYFNNLLTLATPPGQRVTISSINPGTLVTNGTIVYQLLAGQRVAIESGDWPFAGGALILDPTTFAFGQDATRKLTFRVVGLDAAKFIQQLEFENLSATGIFDGILPMYFDAVGGRIEGGRLVVRQGGGTLAYVGDVSNAAMNVYAKLAFDALKSIRYDKLTIELNGALDGEIVSQIDFNGINEAPLSPPKSFIARQFIGLPFVFNIKVTAPFRNLLNTARTFQDPSSLLQRTVPELRTPSVQASESDASP